MSKIPSIEEVINKEFPTDNFDSGDDDDSERLNIANEFRKEGAKWVIENLLPKYLNEQAEFMAKKQLGFRFLATKERENFLASSKEYIESITHKQ